MKDQSTYGPTTVTLRLARDFFTQVTDTEEGKQIQRQQYPHKWRKGGLSNNQRNQWEMCRVIFKDEFIRPLLTEDRMPGTKAGNTSV